MSDKQPGNRGATTDNRKEAQSRQTRADLIAAALPLFAERGYAATPTEEIVQAAGMTRGALYHHFGDKAGLFRAVFEHVEEDLTIRVATTTAQTAGNGDALDACAAGCRAFLQICIEPAVRQIAMIDGPSVLGRETWREIDERYGLAMIQAALELARGEGLIADAPVDALAHLFLGAVIEAGMVVAEAEDTAEALERMSDACEQLIQRLRLPEPR